MKFIEELSALRKRIEEQFAPSREKSLALTKLDECELWLMRAKFSDPTDPAQS